MFPPSPLNSTAHPWHHPTASLHDRIQDGSEPGQEKMPAWGERLSGDEIDAVIGWFQSQWSDRVYGAWYDINQRNR